MTFAVVSGSSGVDDNRLSRHTLPQVELDQMGRLMTFNWMVGARVHRDRTVPSLPTLALGQQATARSIRRASIALVDRHGLTGRYVSDANGFEWLLLSDEELAPVARTVGVALLGGWVRDNIERRHVAQQLRVLTSAERSAAMARAASMTALPFSDWGASGPILKSVGSAVSDLGFACMVALLDDSENGARERFEMRFAPGRLPSISLTIAQRKEASGLINDETLLLRETQGLERTRSTRITRHGNEDQGQRALHGFAPPETEGQQ